MIYPFPFVKDQAALEMNYKIKKDHKNQSSYIMSIMLISMKPRNGFNLNTIAVFLSTHNIKKMAYRKMIIPVRTRRATTNVVVVQIISKRLQVAHFGSRLG